jgi:hypothetical protein
MRTRPNVIILFFALASTALFWPAGKNANAQTDNGAAQTSTQTAAENSSPSDAVNVFTYHNDIGRTGRNLAEKILTTSNVKSSTFGKVWISHCGWVSGCGADICFEPLHCREYAQRGFRGYGTGFGVCLRCRYVRPTMASHGARSGRISQR